MASLAAAVSPLARVVELGAARAASDAEVARRLHPRYATPLARAPRGDITVRGLPFRLGGDDAARQWLLIDRPVVVDMTGIMATHIVLFQFCDSWRDAAGDRPRAVPIGWVVPLGEPLAQVAVTLDDGNRVDVVLRRRFEVNEGIIGWGSMAFRAVPHRVESPVEPLGAHPPQQPGRYAPTGHAGPMTILPGGWGARQSGVEDHVPSATDELMFWLHAIEVADATGAPRALRSISMAPIEGPGDGRVVVVGAMTTFSGNASPLRWQPRRSLRLTGASTLPIDVDLGVVARRRALPVPPAAADVAGWGVDTLQLSDAEEIEISVADDATIRIGGQACAIPSGRTSASGDAPDVHPLTDAAPRIQVLPRADRRLSVTITDGEGRPAAARVRIHASDGRYLPPLGHRDTVNPGLYEDIGADLELGGSAYAYVDGAFEIDLPADGAQLIAVAGPDAQPIQASLTATDLDRGSVGLTFEAPVRPSLGTWVSGDSHVHYLSPPTALLQARAEGINVVHLLATQWGDLHTSMADLGGDQLHASGEHAVWVGSENRQNMLGHVGLVGASRPILPFASGGAPEGRIGGAVDLLMADWLERNRAAGGLNIAAHFPLPLAEIAADIALGLVDALEFQCFDPTLDGPPIREWYRYLDAGYRLPIVGGTDRMSAGVPVGQIRTWARLEDGASLTFAGWSAAIRAGRTFVTSGPILELRVDGRVPGDELRLDHGAHVEVELVARAAQPVISVVEVIRGGRVVASQSSPTPTRELMLRDTLRVDTSGWMAGRSRSPLAVGSAFASSMAAHTSAIYLEVPDHPRPAADAQPSLDLLEGTLAWLRELAPIADRRDLARFEAALEAARRRMEGRASAEP